MSDCPELLLPPGQGVLKDASLWPIVGERAPAPGEWDLAIGGMVERKPNWPLKELKSRPQIDILVDIHCVTRWSKAQIPFSGVRLLDLLAEAGLTPGARFLRFVAHSPRAHDASLSLEDVRRLDPLIAFTLGGQSPPEAQGGPIRLVIPGKYYYKSVKWLKFIEVSDELSPGFWERTAGYHENADPWREERYQIGTLDPRLRERLIRRRVFAGRSVLGGDFSHQDLTGLNARAAVLRACKFPYAVLNQADFSGANLSNALFQGADLTGARFIGADVEGADFSGANLTEADFSGASLFGASFTGPQGEAILARARIAPEQAARLTDDQRAFLTRAMGWD